MIFFLFDDKTEPADIFAEIPSEKAEAKPPMPSPAPGAVGTTPLPVGASGVILERSSFGKKGVILGILGIVLLGGGAAAFLLMRKTPSTVAPETPLVVPNTQPEPTPQPQPEPPIQPQPEPQPQPAATDTDGDGLSDAREAQLGTNPSLVDTDNDGLSDREEVEVYTTNPLNPDTDGDTFKDGDEVRNGYDPKGPGKLLQIPPTP